MEKNKAILNRRNLDELIEIEFGKKGTKSREEFDKETEAFCLAETLKEERIRAGLTQEELAEKIGTKKTYISRLENGKSDIQLNTLFRIFEGLGRRVCSSVVEHRLPKPAIRVRFPPPAPKAETSASASPTW